MSECKVQPSATADGSDLVVDFVRNILKISGVNKYVKEVYLNGKRFEKISISHSEIAKGGNLTFVMTDKAN